MVACDLSDSSSEVPELMVLEDYKADQRRGPAIWIKCMVAG